MKKFLAATLVVLSVNAFATEVELTGSAQTDHYTYHSKTTCWYKGTTFEVAASDVARVSVFTKQKNAEWWDKAEFSYKLEGEKAFVALRKFSHTQVNNEKCPKVLVQLVK